MAFSIIFELRARHHAAVLGHLRVLQLQRSCLGYASLEMQNIARRLHK